MAKFRKKPVVIEAVQLTWANWSDVCNFVPKEQFGGGVWLDKDGNPLPGDEFIFSSEGRTGSGNLGLILLRGEYEALARGDEWLVKFRDGDIEIWPNETFAATYAPVED